MQIAEIASFYDKKKVLVTGHTGFKGTWLTKILLNAGALVIGYSQEPPTKPGLFDISGIGKEKNLISVTGDVRNFEKMKKTFECYRPEIVFHLAAQPIVRDSYKYPLLTYETNVMGTVNLLECVRTVRGVKSVLNVTTDKVYKNNEWEYGYRENEPLDGFDPYSNSKSCSELATHSYKAAFFDHDDIRVSTARAGNVIGGGDFARDRIIPDCIRAIQNGLETKKDTVSIKVRNPYSVRPYQHVLEPLFAYLMIATKQYENKDFSGYYNVGPDECDCITTGELVSEFCKCWNDGIAGKGGKWPVVFWENGAETDAPHEADFLKLDCSKIKTKFDWRPAWHIEKCINETVHFSKVWLSGGNVAEEMNREIRQYSNLAL